MRTNTFIDRISIKKIFFVKNQLLFEYKPSFFCNIFGNILPSNKRSLEKVLIQG